VVLDCHLLAFSVSGFVETFAKRGRIKHLVTGLIDKSNYRQARLLRACRQRPGR